MMQVLDLGCGSGQDCYLASALVGTHGAVTGIDMTAELLDVGSYILHTMLLKYSAYRIYHRDYSCSLF